MRYRKVLPKDHLTAGSAGALYTVTQAANTPSISPGFKQSWYHQMSVRHSVNRLKMNRSLSGRVSDVYRFALGRMALFLEEPFASTSLRRVYTLCGRIEREYLGRRGGSLTKKIAFSRVCSASFKGVTDFCQGSFQP